MWSPTERRLEQLGNGGFCQRSEADHISGRIGRHGRKQLAIGAWLARPVRHDERHIQFFEPREEEGQVTERGSVCPVRVVDDQAERPDGSEVRAEPIEAVEDREGGIDARRKRIHCSRAGEAEHAGRHARSALQQIGAFELGCLDQHRLEQLTHHSEGEIALELGPSRAKHAHSVLRRRCARRSEQRRLADPGRTFDNHEPAAPRARVDQRRFDPRQLIGPLEQRFGGRGRLHARPAYSGTPRRKVWGVSTARITVPAFEDRGDSIQSSISSS